MASTTSDPANTLEVPGGVCSWALPQEVYRGLKRVDLDRPLEKSIKIPGVDLDTPHASRCKARLGRPPSKSMQEKMMLFQGVDLDNPLASLCFIIFDDLDTPLPSRCWKK